MIAVDHQPIRLSFASAQWLLDQRLVAPGALGLLAGKAAGAKQTGNAPDELKQLGLIAGDSTDELRRAVAIAVDPHRRVRVLQRVREQLDVVVFYVRGNLAVTGTSDDTGLTITRPFPSATLSTALSKKLSGTGAPVVAIPGVALGVLNKLFMGVERKAIARKESEVRPAFPTALDVMINEQLIERSGDEVMLSSSVARALEAMWSGESLTVEVDAVESPEPRCFTFFGPPQKRLWSFDKTVQGAEVTVFHSMPPPEAATFAGALAGL